MCNKSTVFCNRGDCVRWSNKDMPSWSDCGECTKVFVTIKESGCEDYLKKYIKLEEENHENIERRNGT